LWRREPHVLLLLLLLPLLLFPLLPMHVIFSLLLRLERSFNLFCGKNSSITISPTTTSSLRLPLTILHHRFRTQAGGRSGGREHERVIRQMITPLAQHRSGNAKQVCRREERDAARGQIKWGQNRQCCFRRGGSSRHTTSRQHLPTYLPTYSSRYLFIVTVPTHLDFIGTYQSRIYHVLLKSRFLIIIGTYI
jgi:hypothetical protein